MSVTIRTYKDGDLYYMDKVRLADSIAMGPVTQLENILLTYSQSGPAISFIADGKVIAIVGGLIVWPGVMELWALTTKGVEKYPIFFHKSAKMLLDNHREALNLHRIQCTVHCDNHKAKKWIERLGFNIEGIHEMYGPDKKDHIRFAKIWRS